MLRIRRVELQIANLYSEQEMRCPIHLSVGQEAVAVGVCSLLKNVDKIFSAHRSHAHYLAKGGNLKSMISELYGKSSGCAMGIGGSMHLLDLKAGLIAAVPIVGSTIPIAVGSAWSEKLRNINNITAAFFGEGATETGVYHETLGFASLQKIPIIFICENNKYSVYTKLEDRQSPDRSIKKNVESFGIKYFEANGNDVIKVYCQMKKALDYIKKYKKPVFLHFDTYRHLEHCGPNDDDHLAYRPKLEVIKWKKNCPITKLEKSLIKKSLLTKNKIQIMNKKIDDEINLAFSFSKKSKFFKKSNLNKYIYS